MSTADELKQQGNEYFVKGSYVEAIKCYTNAVDAHGATAVLLTNRAAANMGLEKFVQAREDAAAAIQLDQKFVKAYYRKASAELKLGMERAAFSTWMTCAQACDMTQWLKQQLNAAVTRWHGVYKTSTVDDSMDFLERYSVLPTSREKLSTLAHFWNESSKAERLQHFHYFLQLVGNTSEISEVYRNMMPEQMPDMPMHNYADLPIDGIPSWRTFFHTLDSDAKTALLKMMYEVLNNQEQGLVIQDLSVFIKLASARAGIGSVPSSSGAGGEVPVTFTPVGVDEEIARYVKKGASDDEEAAEVAKSLQEWKSKFGNPGK